MNKNADTSSHPNSYKIKLRDCNSITEAQITLRRESLNIKYGPNGLGKSTIARALLLNAKSGDALDELLPFKYRQSGNGNAPTVEGADEIKNVLVFNEEYVSQFVFQPDEVVKNSFEIFIKTPKYEEGIKELETIFGDLRKVFLENEGLDTAIKSFTELRDAFKITSSGAISKSSKGAKAISVGGKLESIPDSLVGYEKFLRGDNPAGWLKWQADGKSYLDISDNCPFCSVTNVDKKIAVGVSEEYQSAAVKNMGELRLVIDKLAGFFVPAKLDKLQGITKSLEELSSEQEQFLRDLRDEVETLLEKFNAMKQLSFESIREIPEVDKELRDMKIDLESLDALNSEAVQGIVEELNGKLDDVAGQITRINRCVGKQKTEVADSIRCNQDEINEFLRSAGYKYKVRIESSGDSYRMILEHEDATGHLENAGNHLSFGERNAFALVLFMHQVRRAEPDLVVLDDPISSFDKTKKFAILHKLFQGEQSLCGFTTLLLTHDIEPAIDIVGTGVSTLFRAAKPVVHFLRSQEGKVAEKRIKPADIKTFTEVCKEIITSEQVDSVIKCIYLRRRYEVHGDRGDVYDVLSSLLHLRDKPSSKGEQGGLVPLGEGKLAQATQEIQKDIQEFGYDTLLAELKDKEVLKAKFDGTEVGYEKVQIFRIASELNPKELTVDNAAFDKFVNESYHIENEYVAQLNPHKFDAVPEHIVQTCASLMAGSGG